MEEKEKDKGNIRMLLKLFAESQKKRRKPGYIRMKEQDDVIFANCTITSSCFCAIYEKMYGDRCDSLTEKTASAIIKT